ncbi:MAG: hypothetical protein J0L97_03195, partial [Alphaproteobacteria bacterium]|nr:hypothetical protein [Alphaproteobacteria bacterium]
MSKVTSFICDIKLTADGPVILELGASANSHFSGFDSIRGMRPMRTLIHEDLRELGIPNFASMSDNAQNSMRHQMSSPDTVFCDGSTGLDGPYENKAMYAWLTGTQSSMAPAQGVYTKHYTPELADQIRAELGEREAYVLKATT